MPSRSHLKGYPIVFDNAQWKWLWEDTGVPIDDAPRVCRRCGRSPTAEGHDACLGTLPRVKKACCGHGVPGHSYVWFTNGTQVRNFDTVRSPDATEDLSEV